jgi:hypothetical protein
MNWKKLLTNIGVSAASAFGAIYSQTGSAKSAGLGTVLAVIANLGGLVQKQPTAEAAPESK